MPEMKKVEGSVIDMETIYQCLQVKNDHMQVVNCEKTEKLAISWLEKNGGGIYRNVLHNFEFNVKAK